MPKPLPAPPMQPSQPLPPGYSIECLLGKGQFGEVYKVRGPGGYMSALKVVGRECGVAERLKEFRSLRLIRGIKPHPNLIGYQGVWLRTADGRFLDNADQLDDADPALEGMDLLILMELAQKSLSDRLRECRGGLPIDELLDYMRGAARGLDYLHKELHDLGGAPARVIHRDVKPANLLIYGEGDVKVADYGVARAVVRGVEATQSISCTPEYAAPEVHDNQPVPASDQYSLAITYYQLRTGVLPAAGLAALAQARQPGQAFDFRLVPEPEQAVLHRATHIVPAQRYPSCAAFVRELESAVRGSPAADRAATSPGVVTPGSGLNPPSNAPGHATVSRAGGGTDPVAPAAPAPSQPPPSPDTRPPTPATPPSANRPDQVFLTGRPGDTIAPGVRSGAGGSVSVAEQYERVRVLGAGAFAEVWLVRKPNGMEKALKVLHQPADQDAAKRELRSLEAVKNLRHPYLLATEDFWVGRDDNRLYIVMELADYTLRGRLKQCLAEGQPGIPEDELFLYFQEAAEGLDYLHGKGVVHRDVKPDNVLVLNGHAKVADFGLARQQDALVASMSLAGTPAYMAPEVWGGEGGPASDLYSLAVAYAELRQGKYPLKRGTSISDMMIAHLDGLYEFAEFVPPAEQAVLRKAMSRTPGDRYPSCRAFVEDLARAAGRSIRGRSGLVQQPKPRQAKPEGSIPPQPPAPGPAGPREAPRPEPGFVTAAGSKTIANPPLRSPPAEPRRSISRARESWQKPTTPRPERGSGRRKLLVVLALLVVGVGVGVAAFGVQWRGKVEVVEVRSRTKPDFGGWLAIARGHLGRAAADPGELDAGLDVLNEILRRDPPDEVRDPARVLQTAWQAARDDLGKGNPPQADRMRFGQLAADGPTDPIDPADRPALRALYDRLADRFPTAGKMLEVARGKLRAGQPDAGVADLNTLLGQDPPDDIRLPARALKAAWESAINDRENAGKSDPPASDRQRFKDLTATSPEGVDDPLDRDALRAFYGDLAKKYPPRDFAGLLTAVRHHFRQAKDDPRQIDDGLADLKALLDQNPPGEFKQQATALQTAWEKARADGTMKASPGQEDRVRFEQWSKAAPPGLDDPADRATLQAYYGRLADRFPTAGKVLATARGQFQAGKHDDGVKTLDDLLGQNPPADIRGTAEALRKAWKEARALQAKLDASRPGAVSLGEFEKACDGATKPGVPAGDEEPLRNFYRGLLPKLAERFARSPDPNADWAKAETWSGLDARLAKVGGEKSEWVDLLRAEAAVMARHLGGKATGRLSAVPALKPDTPADLAAYHAFVSAGREWYAATGGVPDRDKVRGPADRLAKAVGAEAFQGLLTGPRKRLAGELLLRSARGLRPDRADPDAPYGGDKDTPALARGWLRSALPLLSDEKLAREARGLLLLAAAFPDPDRKLAADALGAEKSNEVAGALGESGRAGFWLAYARTRDPKAEIGKAVEGYERVVADLLRENDPARLDLAFVTRLATDYLLDKGFTAAVAAADQQVRTQAGERVYAPLARAVFQRRPLKPVRAPEAGSPAGLAAELADRAAGLTADPVLEALAGVFRIETGRGWGDLDRQEVRAEELLRKSPAAAAPLAYLGSVLYLRAAYESEYAKKIDLFTRADASLQKAAEAAEQPGGEQALLTQLYRDLAVANINLANYVGSRDPGEVRTRLEAAFEYAVKLEERAGADPWALDIKGSAREDQAWLVTSYPAAVRKQFYRDAVEALKQAIAGKEEYGVVRLHAKMHLGRVRYKWANDFPEDRGPEQLLENAAFSLTEVVEQADRTAEAEADRAEARYWLAMVELARAGLTWGKGARNSYPRDLLAAGLKLKDEHLRKAKEYLDELAKAKAGSWFRDQAPEWLACLACYRAAGANTAADPARRATRAEALAALKVLAGRAPLAAAAFRSQFLLAQLEAARGWAAADELGELWAALEQAMPAPVPVPASVQEERDLLAVYMTQYRARALRIPALKLPASEDAEKLAAGVLGIGQRDLLSKPELLAQLEALAQSLAAQAAGAESDAPKIAPLATGVFIVAAEIDPTLGFVAKEPWNPKAAAAWRAYVAGVIEKESPKQADRLYEQAESLLSGLPKPDQAALDAIKKRRAALPKQ
jgi:serine/threonine protein kinase